jgi:hypothetical protein
VAGDESKGMTPSTARMTIVRHLVDCLLSHHDVQWEDWPDIGQSDWEDIDKLIRIQGRTFEVTKETLDEAYRLLAARADHE